MKSKTADILKFVFFIALGLFFIYWFLLRLEPEQKQAVWQAFRGANYAWVGVAMGVCLFSHWVRALRWLLLFKATGHRPKLFNVWGATVVAFMANLAFPRLGEVLRCTVLQPSDGIPFEKSLGTVVTERLVDTLAFALIFILGLLLVYGDLKEWLESSVLTGINIPNLALLALLGLLALLVVVLGYRVARRRLQSHKLFQRIDRIIFSFVDGLKSIFQMPPRDVIRFIFLSACIYFLYIICAIFIFLSIPETHGLGLHEAFVVYLFGSVGMGVSQGGIGVYPVLICQALSVYGISNEIGTACGWLLWSSQQVAVIVVGMLFMIYFSLQKKKQATQSS